MSLCQNCGRHIPIQILPFDFTETLRAKQYEVSKEKLALPSEKGKLLQILNEYMLSGGYPEVVTKNLDSKGYLNVLFDSLLFKNVVKRHKVRFAEQIDNLGSYLINNVACQYSIRKLANILGFKSGVTLEKYLSYLTEAYLIFSLNRYSAKSGTKINKLIQVTYETKDQDVMRREVKALAEAGKELNVSNLLVLTWDEKRDVEKDGMTIRFKPLWEWLLEKTD